MFEVKTKEGEVEVCDASSISRCVGKHYKENEYVAVSIPGLAKINGIERLSDLIDEFTAAWEARAANDNLVFHEGCLPSTRFEDGKIILPFWGYLINQILPKFLGASTYGLAAKYAPHSLVSIRVMQELLEPEKHTAWQIATRFGTIALMAVREFSADHTFDPKNMDEAFNHLRELSIFLKTKNL